MTSPAKLSWRHRRFFSFPHGRSIEANRARLLIGWRFSYSPTMNIFRLFADAPLWRQQAIQMQLSRSRYCTRPIDESRIIDNLSWRLSFQNDEESLKFFNGKCVIGSCIAHCLIVNSKKWFPNWSFAANLSLSCKSNVPVINSSIIIIGWKSQLQFRASVFQLLTVLGNERTKPSPRWGSMIHGHCDVIVFFPLRRCRHDD